MFDKKPARCQETVEAVCGPAGSIPFRSAAVRPGGQAGFGICGR